MDIDKLVGATILAVEGCELESTDITFSTTKGDLRLYFDKDYWGRCNVHVSLEDMTGDPSDLIGGVVSVAEERSNKKEWDGKETRWTFYTIRTTKGDLDLRWYGHSNGHYSTSVNTKWTEKVEESEEDREDREYMEALNRELEESFNLEFKRRYEKAKK
jgi:hypothetical protein